MILSKQPRVNIGLVGHVDHGKTTLTEALSGVWTDTHSEEIKRGITIRLGYADTAFYKCPKCPAPECYSTDKVCKHCGSKTELIQTVSFVDAPGHETLMATMISGAAIMDMALLLIAANEPCPQPQTREHLMALQISGIKNIVVVQNKIDLVTYEQAMKHYKQIKEFLKGSVAEDAPIIPISAHHDVNLDSLIEAIVENLPEMERKEKEPARMYISRTFDINKPGTPPEKLMGGVVGGSLLSGNVKIGDRLEIRPDYRPVHNQEGPALIEVVSLMAGGKKRKKIVPGGLVAIGTRTDPYFMKSDNLLGKVIGEPGTLPPVVDRLVLEAHLLTRVVGTDKDIEVEEIRTRELLMLNVGTATTVGVVTSARKKDMDIKLKIPVCVEKGQRAAISRKVSGRWRLIGYAIVKDLIEVRD